MTREYLSLSYDIHHLPEYLGGEVCFCKEIHQTDVAWRWFTEVRGWAQWLTKNTKTKQWRLDNLDKLHSYRPMGVSTSLKRWVTTCFGEGLWRGPEWLHQAGDETARWYLKMWGKHGKASKLPTDHHHFSIIFPISLPISFAIWMPAPFGCPSLDTPWFSVQIWGLKPSHGLPSHRMAMALCLCHKPSPNDQLKGRSPGS